MRIKFPLAIIAATLFALPTIVTAQVPRMINYQGKITTPGTGTPFRGTGYFKFALVDAGGATSYWSNDGTSVAGSEPTVAVPITVNDGVYSVLLGNLTLPGMTVDVAPGIFQNTAVYFRVWFGTAPAGPFTLHVPDIRIVSVGYAMNAATVVDTAITEAKLADGAVTARKLDANAITSSAIAAGSVTTEKLAENAVTSDKLADQIRLGDTSSPGSLSIYPGTTGAGTLNPIKLDGATGTLSADGAVQSRDGFYVTEGSIYASLTKESFGGLLHIYDENENEGVRLGAASNHGGEIRLYQKDGTTKSVWIEGDSGSNSGGRIEVFRGTGASGVLISHDYLSIYNSAGAQVITLDSEDSDGNGRIKTQVLEITGGSDLSENFDVTSMDDTAKPGMIVCIDPNQPGRLRVSSRAYDPMVAGIMSGGGGIKPGMLMGQHGTAADGKHPVALSGRVYCLTDASNGALQPGDLLTTSDLPGYAMKVTDHARAQGAIIGKAMSSLDEGQGLVLVLVSLQ